MTISLVSFFLSDFSFSPPIKTWISISLIFSLRHGELPVFCKVQDILWQTDKFQTPIGRDTDKITDVWSRDFIIWKINSGLWAVVWAGLWEKRVWADYEQLLMPVFQTAFFFTFSESKIFLFFWKHCSIRTETLHRKKVFFFLDFFFYFRKTSFFRAKDATVLVHRGREQTTIGYTVVETDPTNANFA